MCIVQLLPDGRIVPLFADERVQWPDSMAASVLTADAVQFVYVTASRVNTMPFVKGAPARQMPFALYRAPLDVTSPCLR